MGIGSSLFWKSVLRNCVGAPILGFQAIDQTAVSHSCSCITHISARWREVYAVLVWFLIPYVEGLPGKTRIGNPGQLGCMISVQYSWNWPCVHSARAFPEPSSLASKFCFCHVSQYLLPFAPLSPTMPTST